MMSKPVSKMTYPEAVRYYAEMWFSDYMRGSDMPSYGASVAVGSLVVDVLGWDEELRRAMMADVRAEFDKMLDKFPSPY
jgi:hypothetical protein